MDKQYDPRTLEVSALQRWQRHNDFKTRFDPKKPTFSQLLPPPNITGTLHMGHAFQQTLMDLLNRYHRMRGYNVHWQLGTDHASIATQMVVERMLLQEGIMRSSLSREAFIDHVWAWKERAGNQILKQMQRLGLSACWDEARFTMDPDYSKAVTQAFVTLFREGLIVRGKRLVYWDPQLNTAISDLEVEHLPVSRTLWTVRYLLEAGPGELLVATTRPETLFGDVAIAVHPDDSRYKHLIGTCARLPLLDRALPIIGDSSVDIAFGTGAVKITPAHDFNDYATGKSHRLPMLQLFDEKRVFFKNMLRLTWEGQPDGEAALPPQLEGLTLDAARAWTLKALGSAVVRTDTITSPLPTGDRSGLPLEPLLTDQWFLLVSSLAKEATAAVDREEILFIPGHYKNLYHAWMREIQPWCISRQLWWGQRIPAWYDSKGKIYVGESLEEVAQTYGVDPALLRADEDVLDTWFSSALWSFAALGWPKNSEDLQRYHPTSVLITGFDILFFWIARMIMLTRYFIKDHAGLPKNPFEKVYFTGLVQDDQGEKMSKSKGNVLDPLDLIHGITLPDLLEKNTCQLLQQKQRHVITERLTKKFPEGIAGYGADALRMTLVALASTGRHIRWDMQRLNGYRHFCNKLWHASRWVLGAIEGEAINTLTLSTPADHWMSAALHDFMSHYHEAIATCRFDIAVQRLHDFFWHQFCDWYLECAKIQNRAQTAGQLHHTLATILQCAHPVIPFITDTIWQHLQGTKGTILDSDLKNSTPHSHDPGAAADFQWMQTVLLEIRRFRAEHSLAPKQALTMKISGHQPKNLAALLPYLTQLGHLSVQERVNQGALLSCNSTLLHIETGVTSAVLQQSYEKRLAQYETQIIRLNQRLSNDAFLKKAQKKIIDTTRTELRTLVEAQQRLLQEMKQRYAPEYDPKPLQEH